MYSSSLFCNAPKSEVRARLERVPHGFADYEADTTIRQQGDIYDELLIILKGSVAGEFHTYDGKLMRVETLVAPEALAPAFLFSPQTRLPVDMVAVTATRLFRIGRDALLQVASESPQVLQSLLTDIAHRTEFLATKLRMAQFSTLRERLAHYLLDQMKFQKSSLIELPVSKRELADTLGSARQSVSRCFTELEEQGLLEFSGRSIRVVDAGRLRNIDTETEQE